MGEISLPFSVAGEKALDHFSSLETGDVKKQLLEHSTLGISQKLCPVTQRPMIMGGFLNSSHSGVQKHLFWPQLFIQPLLYGWSYSFDNEQT